MASRGRHRWLAHPDYDDYWHGIAHQEVSEPKLLEPGQIYELHIDLWATSNIFKSGHRIRLEVTSSNFPRFDRNTITGGTLEKETERDFVQAVNRVYHDSASLASDPAHH